MGYLLNYKNWEKLYESQLNEMDEFDSINLSLLTVSDEDKKTVDESDRLVFQRYLKFFKDNGIIFSVSPETAAYIILTNTGVKYTDKLLGWKRGTPIKLMDSPKDTSKILTYGNVTATEVSDPVDPSGESDYTEFVKYLNNSMLLAGIENGQDGYIVDVDDNGSAKLVWLGNSIKLDDQFRLYGTLKTTQAQSNQVAKTTVWTVPAEGKNIVLPLPGTMFETNKIEIRDSSTLDAAISELKAMLSDKSNKIKSITIESSASGDRGVGGVSGYPAGTKPGTYPLGKAYIPKTAQESGNAGLAFGRAESIKAKLGNIAPTTVKALIQDGGDAAQYAKIIVNVEKVDRPEQTLSKQELENIVLKDKSVEDLGSTKTIIPFQASTRTIMG
jgi:hypothetical protein